MVALVTRRSFSAVRLSTINNCRRRRRCRVYVDSIYIYIYLYSCKIVDRQNLVLLTSVCSRWVNEGTAIARILIYLYGCAAPASSICRCTNMPFMIYFLWKCRCSLSPFTIELLNTRMVNIVMRRFSLLYVWLLIYCDHAEFHHWTCETMLCRFANRRLIQAFAVRLLKLQLWIETYDVPAN